MKCLLKYQWVKLPRNQLPPGKGIMGSWARLASRAAFRTGQARYCGYTNKVSAGGWAGGIVGLKSILAIKRRRQALEHMDTLADLGYIKAKPSQAKPKAPVPKSPSSGGQPSELPAKPAKRPKTLYESSRPPADF
ncbi:hypothetical protein [Intestinimonas butyriciproducens]|uniref:hypothetical protein n=1 Tax=Intestinimonas butyriciproducens TaxID=1297617 RepID=UPI001FAF8CB0|nr:hypothetical protein [Intestinimonas butyriciproducens]